MTKYFKRERVDEKSFWYYKDIPVNVIEIPENATNGDMLQAIFPNCVIDTDSCGCITTSIDGKIYWSKKWWNAPYKRGDTE